MYNRLQIGAHLFHFSAFPNMICTVHAFNNNVQVSIKSSINERYATKWLQIIIQVIKTREFCRKQSKLAMVFKEKSQWVLQLSKRPFKQRHPRCRNPVPFWIFGIHFKKGLTIHVFHFHLLDSLKMCSRVVHKSTYEWEHYINTYLFFRPTILWVSSLLNTSFNCIEVSHSKKSARKSVTGILFQGMRATNCMYSPYSLSDSEESFQQ